MKKIADNSMYLVIVVIMAAQGIVMVNAALGQLVFASASAISFWRCCVLQSPKAEKVRDAVFVGLSVALLAIALHK